jgi:predicted nucleic acid-binding protein
VRGYLIDVNHVTAWEKANPLFMDRLSLKPPECLIFVSAATLAELVWGNAITTTTDSERRKQFKAFVMQELWPYRLGITGTTSLEYAEILERVWRKTPPKTANTRTDHRLLELGVDINDVWMVATAMERNLTLLTQDKMTHIREVVPEVVFEDWTRV